MSKFLLIVFGLISLYFIMLKQEKSANDILLSFDLDPESLDPSLVSLISTLITMLASFIDTIDSNFQDINSKIDDFTKLILSSKNKNSSNSSLPPSKDGYKKPNKSRSLRESSDRKPGVQTRHKGKGLAKVTDDEAIVTNHIPNQCMNCSHKKE